MRQAHTLVVVCAFFCMAAFYGLAQDDSSGGTTVTIQGTVVNSVTGAGVGRALVYSPDNRFATFTDDAGHFEFSVPKSMPSIVGESFAATTDVPVVVTQAPNMLFVRKPGFLDGLDRPTITSPEKSLTISLVPEAIIKGRIALSDSDAAEGINVELFTQQVQDGRPRWMRSQSVRANSRGEFRFASLRPGPYKVMTSELLDADSSDITPKAQLYGFPPAAFPGVADLASGQVIQLTAGQVFEADIALKRQPYFHVQIPVADFGEGVGMNVHVLAQGHPGPGYSLGYNASTQKIEGLLPRGNYLVEASSFGTGPSGGSVNISVAGNMSDGPTLTMTSGALIPVNLHEEFNSTNWNATASFGSGAAGRSYTFHSGPRTYLNVWLEPADDFNDRGAAGLRMPRSQNDNTLVIEGTQPGRYWVRVITARGYVAAAISGTTDLLREPLVVMPGGGTQIDITLRDDFSILEGKVTGLPDASSGPSQSTMVFRNGGASFAMSLQRLHIYCIPLPNSSGQFAESWTSSDGSFNMPQIAPGTYRVLAFDRPEQSLPYRDAEAMRAYDSLGEVVHLSAGQTQHVQLQLISGEN